MLTYQTFYQHELKKLIVTEIERLMENLGNGMSTPDFSSYKHQVGIIEGLRRALQLCDEAEAIADSRS
jgi:hypothetical protein